MVHPVAEVAHVDEQFVEPVEELGGVELESRSNVGFDGGERFDHVAKAPPEPRLALH